MQAGSTLSREFAQLWHDIKPAICLGRSGTVTGAAVQTLSGESAEGPLAFAEACFRRPLLQLPQALRSKIMDFAYMPIIDVKAALPRCQAYTLDKDGEQEKAIKRQCDDACRTVLTSIFSFLAGHGSHKLPSNLNFYACCTGCQGRQVSTTRIVTFDGYFKLEDRCRSPSSSDSLGHCGTDFWCTARCLGQRQGGLVFEAQVWLVAAREGGPEPMAHFKVPSSVRYFQLHWIPGTRMTITVFQPTKVMAASVGWREKGTTTSLRYSKLLQPLRSHKFTFQPIDDWQTIAFTTEYPMFCDYYAKSLGDHYFYNVNELTPASQLVTSVRCYAEIVTDPVIHDEAPMAISQGEAALVVDEQLASWVMHQAGAASSLAAEVCEPEFEFEQVYLLRVTKNPKEFELALHEGRELEEVRAELAAAGCSSRLPSGAAIFVHPDKYAAIRQALATEHLRPYHIVVSHTFLEVVKGILGSFASRLNVRVKETSTTAYAGLPDSQDPECIMVVERTFLSIPRVLLAAQSVVQSTAEVHGAPNPRRISEPPF